METRAHYALVGGAALLLMAGATLFVLWLGQLRYSQELIEYDVVFQGPVRGLSEAGEVRFNGIKVGDVTRLGLDPSDPNNVIARISIDALTPVKVDSTAQLEPQGLTGVSYIQIIAGSPNSPPLADNGRGPRPIIYAKLGPLEGFVANAEDVMNEAEAALQRLQVLLNEENLEKVNTTLDNVQVISEELRNNASLLTDAREAVVNIGRTAAALEQTASSGQSLLDNEGREAISNIAGTAEQAELAVAELREFVSTADGTLDRLAGGGSGDVSLLIGDLRSLAQTLEVLVADLQDNPTSLIAGAPRQEVEIPR